MKYIGKPGIKINSEENDGHKDEEKLIVIGFQPIPESLKLETKEKTGYDVENFYIVVYEGNYVGLPVVVMDFKIKILSEELKYLDFTTDSTDSYKLQEYYTTLKEGLSPMGAVFYEDLGK